MEKILRKRIRERSVRRLKKKIKKIKNNNFAAGPSDQARPHGLVSFSLAPGAQAKEEAWKNTYIYMYFSMVTWITGHKSRVLTHKDFKEDKEINFFLPRSSEERSFTRARCGRLLEEGEQISSKLSFSLVR